jgi:PAS domain S-box-containing protein
MLIDEIWRTGVSILTSARKHQGGSGFMEHALRVLIVEDRVDDAEVMCRDLCRERFVLESLRVETEKDFLTALRPELDIIIADHNLPGFDASRALVLVKQRALDVPVIVVSGTIGEELAVRIMQEGAADYLLKDRLGQLGMAVRRALERRRLEASQRRVVETALRREQRVRLLLESAAEGVLELDANGVCTFANQSATRLLGRSSMEDMLGKHLHGLVHGQQATDASCAPDETCLCRRLCQNQDVCVEDGVFDRADGRSLLVECRSHPIRHADQLVGHMVVFLDITERRRAEREVLEISERERVRIGQDLHDGLGQDMTSLVCLIESLGRKLHGRAAAEVDYLPRIQELLKNIVVQMRGLSRTLRPVTIERSGLTAALVELTTSAVHAADVACEFESDGPVRVDAGTATHLYRIVQEALSNAIRHANAKRIRVTLKNADHGIALTVRDDGVGIPDETNRAVGLGLKIMAYRARIIGGDLRVAHGPEGGTIVECVIAADRNPGFMKPLGTWRPSARRQETNPQKTGQMAKM